MAASGIAGGRPGLCGPLAARTAPKGFSYAPFKGLYRNVYGCYPKAYIAYFWLAVKQGMEKKSANATYAAMFNDFYEFQRSQGLGSNPKP